MRKFTVIVLVLGLISCGHPATNFKAASGTDFVVYKAGNQMGYDPGATWTTQRSFIIDDSASGKGHWGIDTMFTIHRYITDTLKVKGIIQLDSLHHPLTKTDTMVLGQLPSSSLYLIRFPK